MTPEQKEAFRREVLEEAAKVADDHTSRPFDYSYSCLSMGRGIAAAIRSLAASQPAREMTGFLSTLSDEQRVTALGYDGPDTPAVDALHGPYGYLIMPEGLAEDGWYLADDPRADAASEPLFAKREIPLGKPAPAPAADVRASAPAAHPDDEAVDRFAAAMRAKLAKKRAEGRGGWDDKDDCSNALLSRLLREHVDKGDPLDVGNLAMMLHQRGERIAPAADTGQAADDTDEPQTFEELAEAVIMDMRRYAFDENHVRRMVSVEAYTERLALLRDTHPAPLDVQRVREEDNLAHRCADILQWKKTGVCPDGPLRELANSPHIQEIHGVGSMRAVEELTLVEAAQFVVDRAALRQKEGKA